MRVNRRLLVLGLDVLVIALAVAARISAETGGFVIRVLGIRITFGTPARALLWVGVILVLRLVIWRRTGPFGIGRSQWQTMTAADPLVLKPPPGSWRRVMFASLGIGAALALLLHTQIGQPFGVPDYGDPLFSMWRIGWVIHQIVADPQHLFDGNIFYPERLTLTLSDPMLLPALMAAPMLGLGVHPVVAYNLLLISGFWFSGIATYLLVERLTASPRAAFIAGLAYACYAYRFEHYSHLELQMTQWMPLGLLALHLFLATRRWPYVMALALAGVAQLYSSMYYAVFFLIYIAAIGLGLLLVHRPPIRRLLIPVGAAIVVAAVMATPIARAFAASQQAKGERSAGEVRYYSALPVDYLRANHYSMLWHSRMLPPAPERTLFPGGAPLVLGALGLVPPLGAIPLVYSAGLLVAFDGSLGLNGVLYPSLYRWLGPVRGLRAPARFGAIVGLTLAILAGFGARRALRWCRSETAAVAMFALLIAMVMVDAWPTLTLRPVWKDPPTIYEPLRNTPGVVLAEFPIMPDETGNIPFMYFSMWHWAPMVNGYSGFIPASYAELHKALAGFPDPTGVAALRSHGVTHVTINCGLQYPGCNELRSEMRFSPLLRLITDSEWQGRPAQLYELAGR